MCVLCVWTSPSPHSQTALIIRLYLSWTELTRAAFSGSFTLLMKHHKSEKTHVPPLLFYTEKYIERDLLPSIFSTFTFY